MVKYRARDVYKRQDNGIKQSEFINVNGKQNGPVTMWHDNGEINVKGSFINDEKDGKFEVYVRDGELSRTEFWNKGVRTGEWVINYDKDWEYLTNNTDKAFYRTIDFANKVPETLKEHVGGSIIHTYKAVDYYLDGKIQWEGYIYGNTSPNTAFKKQVFVEVGPGNWYNENGKIIQKGSKKLIAGGSGYDPTSFMIGIWKVFDSNGSLEKVAKYDSSGNLAYSKGKDEVAQDEKNYKKLIVEADKMLVSGSYSEAKNNYKKALIIYPDEAYPKKKLKEVELAEKKLKEATVILQQTKEEWDLSNKEVSLLYKDGKKSNIYKAYLKLNEETKAKFESEADIYKKTQILKNGLALNSRVKKLKSMETKEKEKSLKKTSDLVGILEILWD